MPHVHLICGKVATGKTTYARRIEREHGALLLSVDALMLRLYGKVGERDLALTRAQFEACEQRCKQLMLELTEQVLGRGVDVVLDWGFWSHNERERVRGRIRAAGAAPVLHYLDVPLEERWHRIERRNAESDAAAYIITREMFDLFEDRFEPPGLEEVAVPIHLT